MELPCIPWRAETLDLWLIEKFIRIEAVLQRLRKLFALAPKLQKWKKLDLARRCCLAGSGAQLAGVPSEVQRKAGKGSAGQLQLRAPGAEEWSVATTAARRRAESCL